MKRLIPLAVIALAGCTSAPEHRPATGGPDGVVRRLTPVMGWSSWNSFGSNINYGNIRAQMDELVALGLRDVGWEYVNIDDCYQDGRDGETGRLKINLEKFPQGEADLKRLADYAHRLGLKAGMYSDGGDNCCASGNTKAFGLGVGLYGHEREDLEMFLGDGPCSWGYDFIKIDWCGGCHAGLDDERQYGLIMDVIEDIERKTGKDKIVNICRWAYAGPWQFRADSWRSGPDIDMRGDSWESVMVQVDLMKGLWQYTRPGSMNDPDMLVCGLKLTPDEDRSHFAMWCMFSSPLLIGQDLRNIRADTLELYRNTELIALDQDPAVLSAAYLGEAAPGVEIWCKLLGSDRSPVRALALLNRNGVSTEVELAYSRLGYTGDVLARDLFAHADLPKGRVRKVTLPPHGIDVLKLKPNGRDKVLALPADGGAKKVDRQGLLERTRRLDWVNAMRLVERGATLVDVRDADEFAAGHVEGAINVPYTALAVRGGLAADTNALIVCYCKTAKRSAQAVASLDMLGYRNVYFVVGGWSAYADRVTAGLKDVKWYLSDVKKSAWTTPWPVAAGKKDTSWNGKTININGVEYPKGVGTDARENGGGAVVCCEIPEGARYFVAMAGRDRDQPWSHRNTAVFEVWADGQLLGLSPEIGWNDDYLFALRLPEGAEQLKLVARGVQDCNHCAWGGAGFL